MIIAQNAVQNAVTDFDVSDLDTVDLSTLTHKVVVREDAEGNPLSGFLIVGKNSPQAQTALNTIRVENLKRSSKRNVQIDATTDEGATTVIDVLAHNDRIKAMAVTVGWFGFSLEGQPMNFDRQIVERMFNKFPTWQEKVLVAMDVDANFTKVSSKA